MSNIYTDIIDQVVTRLTEAIKPGGKLDKHNVKAVLVGTDSITARQKTSLPTITLCDFMINHGSKYANLMDEDTLNFTIEIQTNALAGQNTLYNTSDSIGPLLLYSDVCDTIEQNTAGTVDVSISNQVQSRFKFDGVIDSELGDIYKISIPVSANTKKYAAGKRST